MKGRHRGPWTAARPWHIGVVLVVALATAGRPVRADDWPSFGLQIGGARSAGERSGAVFSAGSWTHRLVSDDHAPYRALFAAPVVDSGFVVFATQRNLVRALRESDGRVLWQASAGDTVQATPVLWRGSAIVAGSDHLVQALRLTDGSPLWRQDVGAMVVASPLVADERLYVATGGPRPRLLQMHPGTGQVIWQAGAGVLDQSVLAAVVAARGRVFVAEMGGRTHSFATDDGRWQWTAVTGGEVRLSSPLVAGDRLYLLPGGDPAALHALDLSTGRAISGWPRTVTLPRSDADGTVLRREVVFSSPAGNRDLMVWAARVDVRLDRDGDGVADAFQLRERLVAVDGEGQLLWTAPVGERDTPDINRIPSHAFIGTPALFRDGAGPWLVAAVSSLDARVRVLSRLGVERWSAALPAGTRSSPVLANGRLLLATDAGTVHSFLSSSNEPPLAPTSLSPGGGREVDAASVELRWLAAHDPEGQPLVYGVRVDDDGELLRDWDLELETTPGQTGRLLPPLPSGRRYSFAIRATDPHGARSAWSRPESFRTVASPPVRVGDRATAGLAEALAQAGFGTTVTLGAGRYRLSAGLRLPAGVALAGAGPHLTWLDAAGLAVGVEAGPGSELRQLTVAGGRSGVKAAGAAVRLRNVVLRDSARAGLEVTAAGEAEAVNVTAAHNGNGVLADGPLRVRNSLITANQVGIAASNPALVESRFNNVQGNLRGNFQNVGPGAQDLSEPVEFEAGAEELRLRRGQPTTDRGDPADDFSQEPLPNGGRINIGAFGNTGFAELSAESEPAPKPVGPARVAGGACSYGAETPAAHAGPAAVVLLILLVPARRRTTAPRIRKKSRV